MLVEPTVARLLGISALKLVGGAADFATAAASRPAALPACYVMPLDEDPRPSEVDGFVLQEVRASVGVALAVANVSDAKGRAAAVGLESLRQAVMAGLLGWVPGDGCLPFEFGGGSLLGFRAGVLWWQDIFVTQFYIRT